MAIKKSELYSSLWASCDELRGGMDAAGKDGAIKHVMSDINPQGCQVYSFKSPLERRSGLRLSLALHEMSAKQGSHWNLQSQLLRRSARCPGASRIPGKTKASSAVHGLSPTRSDR